ncbi:hypothetical protein, partial [Klebsiella pneumoniae]|uniref:hypothetical protein n=1 Tax=Klebsiella pneumoniae TaxID=573 RepID=UPI002109D5E1
ISAEPEDGYVCLPVLARQTVPEVAKPHPARLGQLELSPERRAGIRRGFILPLSSLSPALIAFASKVIPYHNKPMFSEPGRYYSRIYKVSE